MMAMGRGLCHYFQPPPLPPQSSEMFEPLYYYIRNNETHWNNYLIYHKLCKVTLPDGPPTTTIKDESTTVSVVLSSSTPPVITVKTSSVALPVILSLVIIALVIVVAVWCWLKVKKRRGRENLASLPLKEYATTNYLDNKARNNQCWNPKKPQEPDTGQKKEDVPGTLDKMCVIEKVIAVVKPFSEDKSDKLLDTKTGDGVNRSGDKFGCQNLSFSTDNEENKSPGSAGANSMTPLFDDVDGAVLPNVPEISHPSFSNKPGNEYTPFPELAKSDDSSVTLQGRLPPINRKHSNSVDSSPKIPMKQKSCLNKRTSEPLTELELMCEDLIENRKSV